MPRVLIIEDVPLVRRTLADLAERAGYDVDVAEDGESTLARFRADAYDVILTDHRLPRTTGLELAWTLRRMDAHVAIVILSGSLEQTDEMREDLEDLGACFIAKPVPMVRQRDVLAEAVAKTRDARASAIRSAASEGRGHASGAGPRVLPCCAMTTQISPSLRSEFAPTGTLRVGINHGNNLLVTAMTPEPRGTAPDLGRELGRRLGVPVQFVPFDSAGKLGDGVKTGAWDVAFLGAEPQRAAEIAFTAAYLEIPSTYIVPAGSTIQSIAEVDREGVRIAVPEQAAYGLYLQRDIKHARLVLTRTNEAAVAAFVADGLEALAGLRPRLLIDVTKLPGARLLDGQFTGVQQAIGTPKSRAAAADYLRAFVEEVKASGFVAEAITRSGVAGVSVAPPAGR